MSHRTLATWRCTGRYDLPFVKVGAKVRYHLEDVEAFIERRTRQHTGKVVAAEMAGEVVR